jgi:anti-sigma factor RsiW
MTCAELVDRILDYIAEELDATQRAAIQEHLCGCPNCTVSIELYRATICVVRALPQADEPLAPAMQQRLWQAMMCVQVPNKPSDE